MDEAGCLEKHVPKYQNISRLRSAEEAADRNDHHKVAFVQTSSIVYNRAERGFS